MNKIWLVTEKILGLLIAVWGCLVLYSVVQAINQSLNNNFLMTSQATYGSLIRYNHLYIIVSVFGIFGGMLLLFNDKIGWMLSVVSSALFSFLLYFSSRVNAVNTQLTFSANFKSYGLVSLGFLAVLIVLLLKPFRAKYKPSKRQWTIMALLFAALVLDKYIL